MKFIGNAFSTRSIYIPTFFSKELFFIRCIATGLVGKVEEAIGVEHGCKANTKEDNSSLPAKKQKKLNRPKLFVMIKNEREAFCPDDTEYYFENGLRKVRPYYHTFYTFTKQRWLGKTLREVFGNEFRYCSNELLETKRKAGLLKFNLKPIQSFDVKLKYQDLLTSTVHLHEGPVLDSAINILYEDSDYLVVDKPSSIPVHPTARYRFNSLIYILKKEYGYEKLSLCHRIDKATSGLVIIAKSQAAANKIASAIREKKAEKEYICKVVGEFPSDPEGVICDEVVTAFDRKIGCSCAWKVDGLDWKDATTHFFRLSTDGNTSVLLCKPKTGRTHQIRVHLQYLGFPIVNDQMYNHEAWGDERFKHGPCTKNVMDIAMSISESYYFDPHFKRRETSNVERRCSNDAKSVLNLELRDEEYLCPSCENCRKQIPDPDRDEMTMYLHAYRYKGSDWEFQSQLPSWASSS